jgi:hypothetical protein
MPVQEEGRAMTSQILTSSLAMAAALLLPGCGSGGPSAETIAAERAAVAADRAARTELASAAPAAGQPVPAAMAGATTAAAATAADGNAATLSCPATYAGPYGRTIRANPLPPGRARILSTRTIPADGGGGCNIEIGYPGAERVFVMAEPDSCEAMPPRRYSLEGLRETSLLDSLSPADRADLDRLEAIGVIGVQNNVSLTLWVPGEDCGLREIVLPNY